MQFNVAELKTWNFDQTFHFKNAEVFSLILQKIDFYLDLTSPPFLQLLSRISSLC